MAGGTPHNAISSGRKTADAAIKASSGKLHGATLEVAAADGIIIIYDNATAASGDILDKIMIDVSLEGNDRTKHVPYPAPLSFSNGVYVDVTGTGAAYIIHYE